jgi:hypothetical protein
VIPRFFIDRPVFAWVIALGIALAGLLALGQLPIEQYPSIAPPSLTINVAYPGADAATLEQNVTQIIEQELNGVEGYLYMASTSQSNGTASITVTFAAGTDVNVALMDVQNRLRRIEARLPEPVRRQGIQVAKSTSGFLLIVALTSKSGQMSALELGNVASSMVIDELRRVKGVGDLRLLGSEYAMRVWLDPGKLAAYRLSAAEALAAVQEQNSQTAGGQIGDLPAPPGNELNATILTQNRFTNAQQFQNIILRANPDGSTIRLGDVARVELGAADYLFAGSEFRGKPMAGIAVQPMPGANAIAIADGVRARMAELAPGLPADVQWVVPYDNTQFIRISVEEVAKTLVEAMALVFLVMFLFLQNWRATVIPSIVVPIALLGACLGGGVRLFNQRAHAVRHGSGDRHPRRRRDCRDRECRADHDRGASRPPRGDDQGDGADHLGYHRHHAGADRRVHPDGLLPRIDRRHLSAILRDAGDLDRLFGAARAYAHPRLVRDAAQGAQARCGAAPARAGSLLRWLQPLVRPHRRPLSGAGRHDPCATAPLARRVRGDGGAYRAAVSAAARRLPADRGPGLCDQRRPRPARRIPRAHRRGDRAVEILP